MKLFPKALIACAAILSTCLCLATGQSKNDPAEWVAEGDVGYPLKGRVLYTNTGNPIPDMKIECFTAGWKKRVASTQTDRSGEFSLPTLPEGRYYLKATRRGFFTVKTVINVTKDSNDFLDIITEGK